MKTATALAVAAIGAILAFAVTAHTPYVNIQIVGLVLIGTGIVGLVLPRRGRDWLRRTVLVRGSPDYTRAESRRTVRNVSEHLPDERSAPGGEEYGAEQHSAEQGAPERETVEQEVVLDYPPK